MKSEDPDHTYSEKTDSNSPSSETPIEPVKADTEPPSKPTDPILSDNDVSHYLIPKSQLIFISSNNLYSLV